MAEQSQDSAWMDYQKRMDDENMRTLVLLHRVYAGITTVLSFCLVGYISLVFGIIGVAATQDPRETPMPPGLPVLLIGVWGLVVMFVLSLSIVNILCANWIRDRRCWTGVVVVSGLNCLHMPLGLALGVYTLIVINRPSVRPSFE